MPTMKAAIYDGLHHIDLRTVEVEPPAPGYVILDTKRTGICGSDLHNYNGHGNLGDGYALGHEICGVVIELGEGVDRVAVGDVVVVECFSHCGECVYCRTGNYNHCRQRTWVSKNSHGGFAEFTTAHESALFKLPDTMGFEEGAMVEPLAVAVRSLAQSRANHQDRVAVIGGGTIGQLCLAVAKANGVRETLITVKYPRQAELAKELGADHVVTIGDTDVHAYVRELTDGMGMDAVIETAGTAQAFGDALAITRRRGVVVLVAVYHTPLEVNLGKIVGSEIEVIGSNCYAYSGLITDFQAAIDLINSGAVDVSKLITHRLPLEQIAEGFALAVDKKTGSIKVHVCQ